MAPETWVRQTSCSLFPSRVPHSLSPYPGFHPLPPRTGREVFPACGRQALPVADRLIQLSDSLLPVACTVSSPHALHSLPHQASVECCLRLALRYSPRWSSRELSMVVVGPFGHAPSLTVPFDAAEVGSLPSDEVMLSSPSPVL